MRIKKLLVSILSMVLLMTSTLAFAETTTDDATGTSDATTQTDDSTTDDGTTDDGTTDDGTTDDGTTDDGTTDDGTTDDTTNDSDTSGDSNVADEEANEKPPRRDTRIPRIKAKFEKLHEFPKGQLKDASFVIFLQWGYIDKAAADKSLLNWDIDLGINEGKIKLVGNPVLFEGKDKLDKKDTNDRITGISQTTVHWDGLMVRVQPFEKDDTNTIRIELGEFDQTFTIDELFATHGIFELANGRQVAVRAFHRAGDLSSTRRSDLFNRKFSILKKVQKVHKKIKKQIESGNITEEEATRMFHSLKEMENHEYSQKRADKWEDKIDGLYTDLDDGTETDIVSRLSDMSDEFNADCDEGTSEDFATGLVPFLDTPQCAWYTDFVRRLKNSRVANGKGENKFAPGDHTSRAELMTVVLNASGIDMKDLSGSDISGDAPADVKDHWAENGIRYVLKKKLLSGFDDGFRPNHMVTRAETLAMVYRIFGISYNDTCGNEFSDMKNHWAVCIIDHARSNGIISGHADGTFKPNMPITRAAMSKVISNTVDYIQAMDEFDEV